MSSKTENEIKKDAAAFLGKSEALRSDELTQQIKEDIKRLDPVVFVHQIRQIRELLERVDDRIREQRESFGIEDMNREPIEMTYALKMDLLYHLAFAIHPLTSYGKQCLKEAMDARHAFEELVGGYTTRITPSNISVFLPVLTDDLAEDIRTGRREAIGAIRAKGSFSYGAGALVYEYDGGDVDTGFILRIEWLFVHPAFRGRRIADSLIAEMVYQMHKNPVDALTASFIVGENWEPVMGNIFSRWKFMFGTQMEGDTLICMADMEDPDPIEKFYQTYGKNATPLSAMESRNVPFFLERVLRREEYRGYLWGQTRKPDYIDRDLSCYIGDVGNPDGVMLVHKTPSKKLRVEFVGLAGADTKPVPTMAGYVLHEALRTAPADSVLDFPIHMDEFSQAMDKLAPKQRSALLVTAVLSGAFLEEDVTAETVEEMLSMPEKQLRKEYEKMIG